MMKIITTPNCAQNLSDTRHLLHAKGVRHITHIITQFKRRKHTHFCIPEKTDPLPEPLILSS